MDYFDLTTERDKRDKFTKYKRNFIVCPEQWETLDGLHEDLDWKEIQFKEENKDLLPEVEGLYMFMASPKKLNASFINYLFYVGETNSIKQRFEDYLRKIANPKSGQYKMYALIDEFSSNLYFRYVEFPGLNQRGRRIIEDQFLVAFLPPINSKYPQQLQSIVLGAYAR